MLFYAMLWAVIKDRKQLKAEILERFTTPAPETAPESTAKTLQYIVNGKTIPCTFDQYYYVVLGMHLLNADIRRESVQLYYKCSISDATMNTGDIQDIEAANLFFSDRLDYLNHIN